MSQTTTCWKRSPSSGAAGAWSLVVVFLMAVASPPLYACDGGTAVPDPGNNSGLVEDCRVLLTIRDEWGSTGLLNWDTQLAMTRWQGIRFSGSPSRVTELHLDEIPLTGTLPVELSQLSQLERLTIGGTLLTGPIPTDLGQLSQLQRLALVGNRLTGPIPTELAQLSRLDRLTLVGNQLTGPIPTELAQLGLQVLELDHNQLT